MAADGGDTEISRNELLSNLSQLYADEVLCDVRVKVEGKTFNTHRILLAASSEYFLKMFNGSFEESKKEEVELNNVKSDTFALLMNYIYNGKVTITDETVCDLYRAANYLTFKSIQDACMDYMKEHFRNGYIDYLAIANEYCLDDLKESIQKYMTDHYEEACHMDGFENIEKDLLTKVISANKLKGCHEMDVFESVEKWILKNNPSPEDAVDVLNHVRLNVITGEDWDRIFQSDIFKENEACRKLIVSRASYAAYMHCKPLKAGVHSKLRGPSAIIMLGACIKDDDLDERYRRLSCRVYGHAIDESSEKDGDININKIANLPSLPIPLVNSAVVEYNNFIFVFGGETYENRSLVASERAFRFCPNDNFWIELNPMLTRRTKAAVALQGQFIYIFGGERFEEDEDPQEDAISVKSIDRYDIADDRWDTVMETMLLKSHVKAGTIKDSIYLFQDTIVFKFDPWDKKLLPFGQTTHKHKGDAVFTDEKCIYFATLTYVSKFTPETCEYTALYEDDDFGHEAKDFQGALVDDILYFTARDDKILSFNLKTCRWKTQRVVTEMEYKHTHNPMISKLTLANWHFDD